MKNKIMLFAQLVTEIDISKYKQKHLTNKQKYDIGKENEKIQN